MTWIDTLNESSGELHLGSCTGTVLYWAHQPYTADNRPHRHTFFEICLVGPRGQGTFHADGTSHDIGPGSLFFAGPGILHQIVNTSCPDMDLRWVSVQLRPSSEIKSELDQWIQAVVDKNVYAAPDKDGKIFSLWAALEHEASCVTARVDTSIIAIIARALILAIARNVYGEEQNPNIRRPVPRHNAAERICLGFIQDNLSEPFTVSDLAAQAHISERQLNRLWIQAFGCAPAEYILRTRMDRAASMLCAGETPIKTIAEMVGYDVHQFTRRFTASFGVPPARFRDKPELRTVRNVQKAGEII